MRLYRYTSLEFIPSCVENGVYASNLSNINDPYEGRGIRYPNQYRVVCLTKSPFQMLMWAYYGNHKGCRITYEVDDSNVKPVEYTTDFQSHEDMTTKQVIESLYRKGKEWKHENEYRVVYHDPTADRDLWTVDGEKVFLKAQVKEVVFGLLADEDDRYLEMLKYLQKHNRNQEKIDVSKCRLMSDRYQLEADKQFDIDSEIRMLEKGSEKG